ncbi:MAG TPA: TrkH family potassium uptake protein [Gammaproteobacteria bacterium]|nr:TrkH family potassium uptake protein [Gammaproteobacteria bacterium]
MNLALVQHVLGLLLMLFSLWMLPPAGVAWWYRDGDTAHFLTSFAITFAAGALLWFPQRRLKRDLRLRDGFLIVALFWFALGTFGAMPLVLAPHPQMSFTDAVFEAVSGFTTTGATVLTGLDALPPSINYYRTQLQWLGGMGVVVLAVAILPMLGIGGMQLYRAETPGPGKDAKLTPRITETAKALWYAYFVLTAACVVAYWLAGMTLYDAICHAFATLSTGGYSTHDASMAYFKSPLIEALAIVFMVLGATNFSLHFLAFRNLSVRPYVDDVECRAFILLLFVFGSVVGGVLYLSGGYGDPGEAALKGLFQVVSLMTSTGFTTADYTVWPGMLPVLLILVTFIGGCGGSTGGGMKVVRIYLLYKQAAREVIRLIHPSAELPVKVGDKAVEPRVVDAVWGFCFIYIAVYVAMMLLVIAAGNDQVTAFSAVATCINNAGPALGKVAANFTALDDFSKWVCIFAMLIGRLEVFTVLVILTPAFWQK